MLRQQSHTADIQSVGTTDTASRRYELPNSQTGWASAATPVGEHGLDPQAWRGWATPAEPQSFARLQ
jgi:hypothetical protein